MLDVEEEWRGRGGLGGKVRRAESGPQEPVSLQDIPGGHPEDSLRLLAPPSRLSCLWSQRKPILYPGYNLALHATFLHYLVTLNTEETVPTGSFIRLNTCALFVFRPRSCSPA